MAGHAEPDLEDHLWTIAAARLILGPKMSIQAPPNLHRPDDLAWLVRAGVNDWGGVSPVTPDHVNPEAPWPHLDLLAERTASAGRVLTQRLAIGPAFARDAARWTDASVAPLILRAVDARGLPKIDDWAAGRQDRLPNLIQTPHRAPLLQSAIGRAQAGERLEGPEIAQLFEADGDDLQRLIAIANSMRKKVTEDVTFVVNRNINYTNICLYKCGFCAFSKGSTRALRGPAYRLDFDVIAQRAAEAADRGATEVCLQGGIHPDYDGNTYLRIVTAVREAATDLHIHAFSPLEIKHGADTLGLPLDRYLDMLKTAGLASLPGTAAEILHPEVRSVLCPDKLTADEWVEVMRAAHSVGLRSTATVMFGHVDAYRHWAHHLQVLRSLQEESGGFTEFVPLPFVHMESPIWLKGRARSGPSFREAVLMHVVGRIILGPSFRNIQASWVKMGPEGAAFLLGAGVNDLGGVLMDESITRAAGGRNGQMLGEAEIREIGACAGRPVRQRSTLYGPVAPRAASSREPEVATA